MNSNKRRIILISIILLIILVIYTSLTTARSSYVQNYCKSKTAEYSSQQNTPQQQEDQPSRIQVTGAAIQSQSALDETYLINCCEQQGCNTGYCTGDSQEVTCTYYCEDIKKTAEGTGEIQSCNAKYKGTNPDPIQELENEHVSTSQACGNGKKDPGEECDDENKNNGDGCNSDCNIEDDKLNDLTWTCKTKGGEKTMCTRTCGSGTLEDSSPEQCDDGNTEEGDGCNIHCEIESEFLCIRKSLTDPLQRGKVKSVCEKIPAQVCEAEPAEPCYDKICFPSLKPCSSSENKCSDGKSVCTWYDTKVEFEEQETTQQISPETIPEQPQVINQPQPPKIDPQQYKCPKLGQKMCVQGNSAWCCPPGGLSNLGSGYAYRLCPGDPVKPGFISVCKDERAPSPGLIGACYLEQCRNSQKHITGDKAVKK